MINAGIVLNILILVNGRIKKTSIAISIAGYMTAFSEEDRDNIKKTFAQLKYLSLSVVFFIAWNATK